jgi:hypothetical protein
MAWKRRPRGSAHELLTIGCDARSVLLDADDRRINHLHSPIMAGSQSIH